MSENGTRRRGSSEDALAAARARGRELAATAPPFTPDQRDLIGRVWVPALAVDERTDGAA